MKMTNRRLKIIHFVYDTNWRDVQFSFCSFFLTNKSSLSQIGICSLSLQWKEQYIKKTLYMHVSQIGQAPLPYTFPWNSKTYGSPLSVSRLHRSRFTKTNHWCHRKLLILHADSKTSGDPRISPNESKGPIPPMKGQELLHGLDILDRRVQMLQVPDKRR